MLARLPYGIYALAAILYLAEARDSYAVAGLVDGAFGLGAAVGAPLQSRLIDRLGQRRVLLPAAVVDVAATGVLIALTESGAPTVALVACGLVGGFAVPNVGGALRALWPALLRRRDDLLPAAFALDSVAMELLFTAGPLIAALIIAVVSPVTALVLCAGCSLLGTAAFVTRPPSRAWRPDPGAGSHGALGALRSSGVRTIVFAAVPVGFCFGAVEISLPAFAEEHGAAELAGVLLATWSVGSVAGGLAYGARTWPRSLQSIYVWLSLLLPLGYLPALVASSIAAMALLILPAGLLIAPLAAACNELIGRRRAAGRGDRGVRVAGDRDAPRVRGRDGAGRRARRGGRLARVLRRGGVHGRASARRSSTCTGGRSSPRSRCDFALHGRRCVPSWALCESSWPGWTGRYREGMSDPALDAFTPQVREWFGRAFAEPTPAQAQAWPAIATGAHTLISAPTGSGKTLAAFLWALDRLVAEPRADRTRLVYVSPLKALSYDVEKNLRAPLRGIGADVKVAIRTGDTPQSERRDMVRHPPDILITTPESLYLMLTSQARAIFEGAEQVIVDEIHAVAQTKRGAHLALTLERLAEQAGTDLQRIGLSATQNPLEEVGRFLVGPKRTCTIVDTGTRKPLDLKIHVPVERMVEPEQTRPRPRPVRRAGGDAQVDLARDLPGVCSRCASTARRSCSSTTAARPSGSRCGSTSSPRRQPVTSPQGEPRADRPRPPRLARPRGAARSSRSSSRPASCRASSRRRRSSSASTWARSTSCCRSSRRSRSPPGCSGSAAPATASATPPRAASSRSSAPTCSSARSSPGACARA